MLDKAKILKDAQKYVAKSQWDKAIIEYEKLVKESPNDANNHSMIGDLHLKRNDNENAVVAYKKAAEILNRAGFTLKAIALYKKILTIKPNQIDIYLLLGKLNAERGLIGNANESYLAAAAHYSRNGQKGKAIDVYKILCDLNPDNLTLAQKLAEMYQSEGYEKEALSKFIELAEKKIETNNMADARQLLDKIARKGTGRFDFKRVQAIFFMRSGRVKEAIESLEDARKIDPHDARILQLLAEAYILEKRFLEAAGLLNALLEKEPNNEALRKQLIEISQNTGNFAAAWEECSVLVGQSISNGNLEEAQSIVKAFLSQKPDSIEALHCLADIHAKAGNEAEVDDLHFRIAELYAESGEAGKAENIFRKLIEKNPENEKAKKALSSISSLASPPAASAGGPGDDNRKQQDAKEQEAPELKIDGRYEPSPESSGASSRLPHLPDLDIEELPPVSIKSEEKGAGTASRKDAFEIPDVDFGDIESGTMKAATAHDEAPELPEEDAAQSEDFPSVLDFGEINVEESLTGKASAPPAPSEPSAPFAPSASSASSASFAPSAPSAPSASSASTSKEDSISEIDVLIKYGMIDKAQSAISDLAKRYPEDARIMERRLEIKKALGDIEGFSRCSLALADMYQREGRDEEAEKVLRKAAQIDPGNKELKSRLSPEVAAPAAPEEPSGLQMDDELFNSLVDEPADIPPVDIPPFKVPPVNIPPVKSAPNAVAGNSAVPKGKKDFSEELSEADFYLYQGLKDEARQIYKRILSLDPGNAEVKAKLESLDQVEYEVAENVYNLDNDLSRGSMPAPAFTAPSGPTYSQAKNEFDAAFSEFDEGAGTENIEPVPATEESLELEPEIIPEKRGKTPPEELNNEFFDLAAELSDDIYEEASVPEQQEAFQDKQLEQVFKEFKKGVEEQLNQEDYETHYNLGIAYKEMGMLDEAITEFAQAGRDQSRSLECASMLGLCFIEKGEYEKAVGYFKKALEIKGRQPEEYRGVQYDLASAYEHMGEIGSAQSIIDRIAKEDPSFRDAKERLQRLNKMMIDRGLAPAKAHETEKGPKPPPSSTPKKSKVSYL